MDIGKAIPYYAQATDKNGRIYNKHENCNNCGFEQAPPKPDGSIKRPYPFLKALNEAQRLQRQRYREGVAWCDIETVSNTSVEYFYVHSNRSGDYIYYTKERTK